MYICRTKSSEQSELQVLVFKKAFDHVFLVNNEFKTSCLQLKLTLEINRQKEENIQSNNVICLKD